MHAWVSHTSADTHVWPLHREPLDLPPCVFQVQTLSFRAPHPNLRDVQANKGKTVFLRGVSSLIFVRVETKLLPLSHFGGPWGSRCSCTLYLVTDPDWALFRKNLTGLLIGDLAGSFCLVWVGCHLCCLQAANPMEGCGPHSCFIGAIVRE